MSRMTTGRGLRRVAPPIVAAAFLVAAALAGLAAAAPYRSRALSETNVAPSVTKQPTGKTVNEGKSTNFEATASGKPTPTVQWEVSSDGGSSWSPISGATSTKYVIASASGSENGYEFRATFSNIAGQATTSAATLNVHTPPAITRQPVNTTVEEGQNATFEASAAGNPAPTVQWQVSANGGVMWTNITGATSETLTIVKASSTLSGHQYRAVFTNTVAKTNTEAATLTVQKAPAVTKQPVDLTVNEGQSASFEATASGFPTPSVQWELSTDGGSTWSAIEGATSSKYTIESASLSESGRELRATFTNAAGTATSAAASLTVYAPPVVTRDPLSTTAKAGEAVSFEASAAGTPTPAEQWELSINGGSTWSAIEGATSETLTIAEAKLSENGARYRATFTSAAGKATSNVATLTVATTRYSAVAWGQNTLRQLGDGSAESLSPVPRPVSGLAFVTAIAAGGHHSLALLADGTVMAWGSNEFGQLGDGSEVTPSVPVAVSELTHVQAIAAGAHHSLALLSNGTVMAWGNNESGQLGTGNTTESQVPVAVKGLSNVRAIAAGGDDSFALLASGSVMAWGNDEKGELGNGSTKPSSTVPVAVKGLSSVSALAAGGEFALALLGSGSADAWGSDQYGQLANAGVEEESNVPVPVSGVSGASAIAAGATHALALLSNGTVMAWGEDADGELGNGVFQAKHETPVPVGGLSGVTAISAGGQDSAALLSSGSVMTWGIDNWGQLGDGLTGGPSAVPVSVAGVRKVAAIAAGGLHMVAYGEPIPVLTALSPSRGPLAGGNSVTISGDNFEAPASVKFGTAEATNVTVNSPTSITATAPAGSGTVTVAVTTPAGSSSPVAADHYTYMPPPQVTKLSPKTGTVAGGTAVTITGANFTGVTEVKFGSMQASSYTVTSSSSITATTPTESAAAVQVSVTTEFGTSGATSSDVYKFAPVISSLTPNGGPTAGGTSVTVRGVGFVPGTTGTKFKFGTAAGKSVSCASGSECTVVAPAHEAGTIEVSATVNKVNSLKNPAGDDYTYS